MIIINGGCDSYENLYIGMWIPDGNNCRYLIIKENTKKSFTINLYEYYHGEVKSDLSYPGSVDENDFLEIYKSNVQKASLISRDTLLYNGELYSRVIKSDTSVNLNRLYIKASECNGNIGNGSIGIDGNNIEFSYQDGPGWVEGNRIDIKGKIIEKEKNFYEIRGESISSFMFIEDKISGNFFDYLYSSLSEDCKNSIIGYLSVYNEKLIQFKWLGECLEGDLLMDKYKEIIGEDFNKPKTWIFEN